ncbi:C4-dicarboxylate ABC transporter permease [Alloyangia pacifica]|uniref:TRAP transporter small permease protein n=1 Tax=Alloyangia pacifica TaxID=311180 RepID=A0A2U8HHN4_9RHOB|nr:MULTISPECIES: TRAP transporter small permease [Roseobacteraceae]AWI85241.1 C4-dicarboxylate ABC transporter permease [Alloyangia pacifica]NDV49756.1 TRAP transporter small permease [Salipiger sp. PrR003]NDW33530.1 TRAP transporter small permease [Salipiger sp. PrR007]
MVLLDGLIRPLSWVNDHLLKVGRGIGVVAIAVMVAVTLVQVFCRYVLGNALPWPDEAARFCMLWMTGLMAPTAFRRGGFVAIDILPSLLPRRPASLLNLVLLTVSLMVLIIALQIGWKEVTGLGGRFASASLYIPTAFDFSEWHRVPRSWMMASILVGMALLVLVNIELILRNLAELCSGRALDIVPQANTQGAE